MESKFEISVMTSSSDREIATLIAELAAVSGVQYIDLYLLREVDLQQLMPSSVNRTVLGFVRSPDSITRILEWFKGQISTRIQQASSQTRVAALATFFPEIASEDEAKAEQAVSALIQSIRLADELRKCGLMETPIVEMVCGPTSEHFTKKQLSKEYLDVIGETARPWSEAIVTYSSEGKRSLVLDRLLTVHKEVTEFGIHNWVLALELEPGFYVLNDSEAIRHMFDDLLSLDKYKILRQHVGLNLDIAHMKIAKVTPSFVEKYARWIVHAHICDHPGMHTRDQVLGTWDPVDRFNSDFYKYLRVFMKAISMCLDEREGRPCSKAVAIELEGCNRIMWIHESVVALRHMQLAIGALSESGPS
jgi:sugar phosphate isomerase/epimerase